MSKEKGFCDVCGIEIEINICCNAYDCGCMGLPTEPPVCSLKCYNTFFSKEYREEKTKNKQITFFKPKS